jgi:translation initiation factor IF-2
LKRFKDDVKDVAKGYDCGIQVKDTTTSKKEMLLNRTMKVAVKKEIEIEFNMFNIKIPIHGIFYFILI